MAARRWRRRRRRMGLAMANVLADGFNFNVLRGGNDDAGRRATPLCTVHCRSCLSSEIAHQHFIPAGVYTGFSAHFALHRQSHMSSALQQCFLRFRPCSLPQPPLSSAGTRLREGNGLLTVAVQQSLPRYKVEYLGNDQRRNYGAAQRR
jgi:hypothetical protein